MDEEAVSPVIGVILMVAITVVLGAVVWVLVSQFSEQDNDSGTSMIGQRSESTDRWEIIKGTDRPQNHFSFAASQPGVRYAWNQTATASSPLMPVSPTVMGGTAPWSAGAFLSLCADGALPVADFNVRFVDIPNNKVVITTHFDQIAACA